MALILPPTGDLRNRNTFAVYRPNASTLQRPVSGTRLNCRQDELGNCVEDLYRSAAAAHSYNEKIQCVPVNDLVLSVSCSVRDGAAVTRAQIFTVLNLMFDGFAVEGVAFEGLAALLQLTPTTP